MERLRALAGEAGRVARLSRTLPAALGALVLAAGCGGGGPKAERLLDGTQPPAVPAALRSLEGDVVVTRVRSVRARELDRKRLDACVGPFSDVRVGASDVVVERVGIAGSSLTFEHPARPVLYGCDASAGPTEQGGPWCGGAAGELEAGRLLDPRLTIGCRDASGAPVGFAWVEPEGDARWVAVEEPDYTEVYEVAGGLPVRVTTSRVEVTGSRATFEVAQYAADGREVARETLEAAVAG